MSGDGGDRARRGDATRRAVLGDRFVDRAEAGLTPLDADFRAFTTEGVWGTVWASGVLSPREKSLVTLSLLAAGGQWEEMVLHLHVAARHGLSRAEVMDLFLHLAAYAGVPRANQAIRAAKAAWAEMDKASPPPP